MRPKAMIPEPSWVSNNDDDGKDDDDPNSWVVCTIEDGVELMMIATCDDDVH